jgi:hypothetical protein
VAALAVQSRELAPNAIPPDALADLLG